MKKFAMMFEDIKDARSAFCGRVENVCDKCPLSRANNDKGIICLYFVRDYPEKAAELMDLEAVDEGGKPKLTEQELAICRAVGAKWVERVGAPFDYQVRLWREEPLQSKSTEELNDIWIGRVLAKLFPSVRKGDCINVEDLMK